MGNIIFSASRNLKGFYINDITVLNFSFGILLPLSSLIPISIFLYSTESPQIKVYEKAKWGKKVKMIKYILS